MSDKIDEIIDQLIKGGRGSGIRGHKSGPTSDIKREIDPSKKKKILASDRKAVRKEVRGHSDEKLQSAIDSHKELSESQHLSPGSRESYAAKHKALVSEQKKRNKNKDIESSEREEHGASLRTKFQELSDKWFGKGGPGSGKKGHTGVTPDKSTRERNQQKAGEVRDTGREARKIAAELDLSKDDMKEIRDYASAEGISPSQFIVNNKDHIMTNLKKGGPGSGRKGHKTSEGASAAMSDNRRANTEKYLDQLKTSLSLEKDPAAQAEFKKDIKDIEAELKANKPDEAHDLMSQMKAPGVGSMAKADWEDKIDKSLDTLFYMNQLANQGRIKPKNKRGGRIRKSITDHILEKKQGVPEGVDPAKHERCVLDVKADGKDKSSAYAICNSSMKKGVEPRLPTDVGPEGPEDDWVVPSVTDKVPPKQSPAVMKGKKDKIEKLAPLAVPAVKTVARVVQNAVKPTEAGKGSDVVPGSPDGPSVAHGSGGAKPSKGPQAPKISKSLAERLDKMLKGGPGSGRKGHSLGSDYGESEHDSVFSSGYDNTGEREAFMDKMKAAVAREEERAEQRIKEKVGKRDATSNISRKGGKKPEKKSFLQRLGQGIIDRI